MTGLFRQAARFGMVGLVNTAIGLCAIYAVMFFLDSGPAIANAIGYAIGLTFSFLLNRSWTFGSDRPLIHLLPRFMLVVAISYILNLCTVLTSISHFSADPYFAQVLGVAVYTGCTFLGCRWFAFATPQSA